MASHLAGHKAGIGNAFFKLVSIFPEGFCIPLVFSVENLPVERHGWIHPSALNSAERSALLKSTWGGSTHVSQQFPCRRSALRALGWIHPCLSTAGGFVAVLFAFCFP